MTDPIGEVPTHLADSGGPIRVLHVDDEEGFLDVTGSMLEREGTAFDFVAVTDAGEALSVLENETFDCLVSDYDMPGMDGLELLDCVRSTGQDIPFVLFTGKGSEEIASDAIAAGVTAYVPKGANRETFALLANRIRNAVESYRVRERAQEAFRALEAIQDGLSLVDDEGHFTYLNDAYAKLYGYERESLVGEHWQMLYPGATEQYADVIEPALARDGSWTGLASGRRRDGTDFEARHSFTQLDGGGHVCVVHHEK
jgi:PAS domain S-box-containing protein